ncbi:carbohydrate kinase family protein [Streptomyces sudanensis]|uniref:carbohydrate kinase family protein n=1 Tax=Streptomyces sudanensis TaxID=436397 RepID=UPI0020CF447E|nr:carbohydrate kinase family protein [Streptomyces sudanensis]MCP9958680.1 carbohydrate kinase family protein [Streptomyces sudanensis]MCQ0000825.1 carbohydrate kinase family protein [Streptomyces sudanensis]
MRIAVTGSIATDHLLDYSGRFAEQLIPEQLDRISLSFLADNLEVRRGGVAANISLGLGRLGVGPILVGAAGVDFSEYDAWLRSHGVDTASVHISENRHTARFVCTTDADQNQIATFHPGAMTEAQGIVLGRTARRVGGLDLVVIAPNDPTAMVRHTVECRSWRVPFAADPSQQLAHLDGEQTRRLVDGARLLFTNAYEAALLKERTGWSEHDILERVGTWITTHGAEGVTMATADGTRVDVSAVPTDRAVDPTGVGDAFRAGFLAGMAWRWLPEHGAQLGCALATLVLEAVGAQEYKIVPVELADRMREVYGRAAVAPDLDARLENAL